MKSDAVACTTEQSVLGEGARWDARRSELLRVDIMAGRVYRDRIIDDGALVPIRSYQVSGTVGAITPVHDDEGWLLAAGRGFAHLSPDGTLRSLAEVAPEGTRMNDGACDPQGRFWSGTKADHAGGAALYRFDRNGRTELMLGDLTISNGLDWSPDGGTMYLADSGPRVVHAFTFDAERGTISDGRVLVTVAEDVGAPDGLTVDADGDLWVAIFGGGLVHRYSPDGALRQALHVPAMQSTSCAFAGPGLNRLYVTTATEDWSDEQRRDEPGAGLVYRFETDAAGNTVPSGPHLVGEGDLVTVPSMNEQTFKFKLIVMVCVLLLITPGLSVSAQPTKQGSETQEQDIQFGGTYANLKPAQRRLVDEWFRQYNEITKQNLKPVEEYDELSLSTRTTFEAVTHALLTSKLTDKSGRSLGTALDLVSYVETAHGKIPRTRGDLQFRIYAALKPAAVEMLEASREFRRGRDNTVFHKGYPVNYRQEGGVPSIQFSISPDGKRADIDVDYRSSKFPAAIVNGHLTASNSDVRAGNNHDRHVNRWTGFGRWWKSIFGVPLKEADLKDEDTKGRRGGIPASPRAGRGKPEQAVYDFLNSWLVEQQPNQAVAYISPRAFSCIDQVASDEQKKINPGLVPFYILEEMKKINRTLGKPARLGEVAESVHPNEPALRPIEHQYRAEFDLFETPEDIAFDFECVNRNRLPGETEKGKPGKRYGRYVGASLRLKSSQEKGDRLLILWARESGYWKVISWSIEPDQLAGKEAPEAAQAVAETKLERVAGDPSLIAAAASFFDAWFVKQNFDQAVGYVSEQCYPCINLYLDEGVKKVRNWAEGRQKLREGMRNVAGKIGRKNDVSEAVERIVPAHPALKLVTHAQEQAYALVSVPDEIARGFKCLSQAQGVKAAEKNLGTEVYGNYYGTIFELKVEGAPAALNLLWGRENDRWKIIAYSIEVP